MTTEEKKGYLGYKESAKPTVTGYNHLAENYDDNKDWRALGAVGPIRDEGTICQACWAFAVQSMLESAHFIKSGELAMFSTQQLVDCDRGSLGCQGGGNESAIDYFKTAPIMLEKEYPYVAKDQMCQTNPAKSTGINVI